MIWRALTVSPPNVFPPRRWALESRPLRVDPPPLVLDIESAFVDPGDLDHRIALAMTPATLAAGLVLVRQPDDLGSLGFADHAGRHRRPRQLGRLGDHGGIVDEEDWREGQVVSPGRDPKALHLQALALGHPVLLAPGGDPS